MRRRLRVAAIGAVAATFFFAADSRAEMPGSGNVCLRAARAATRHAGLPPGLLAAIGIVETGRPDPMTGQMVPSPDAVDIHGKGTFFSDAREAVAYVREARASGLRRIDVGCFQIDLGFHQDAFPNLATAFDPAANARAMRRASSPACMRATGNGGRPSPLTIPRIRPRANLTPRGCWQPGTTGRPRPVLCRTIRMCSGLAGSPQICRMSSDHEHRPAMMET